MNFFWTKKEFDQYIEESGQKPLLGDKIYGLNLAEALEAANELFSTLKHIQKAL